jgi:hypothetical protein
LPRIETASVRAEVVVTLTTAAVDQVDEPAGLVLPQMVKVALE